MNIRKTGGVAVILFLAFQLYQPARNLEDAADTSLDFLIATDAPEQIRNIFNSSCYDCHSNHTRYDWFDFIQPVRSVAEYHIKNAKKEVNFSEWGNYSGRTKARLLQSVQSQIKDREMPLPSYLLLHPDARLSDTEIIEITDWLNSLE